MISKQPNGLYCRISTIVDAPTNWNRSENDMLGYLMITNQLDHPTQTLKEWLDVYGVPFKDAIKCIKETNMSREEITVFLREVGYGNDH